MGQGPSKGKGIDLRKAMRYIAPVFVVLCLAGALVAVKVRTATVEVTEETYGVVHTEEYTELEWAERQGPSFGRRP